MTFLSWAYIAHDKLTYSIIINNLGSKTLNLPLNDMVILLILRFPLLLLPQKKNSSNTTTSPPSRIPPHIPPPTLPCPPSFQSYSHNLKIFFRIKNLTPTSSLRVVRRTYYLLTRKYHPDKLNEEILNISIKEREERFKNILNAFEDDKLANCLA